MQEKLNSDPSFVSSLPSKKTLSDARLKHKICQQWERISPERKINDCKTKLNKNTNTLAFTFKKFSTISQYWNNIKNKGIITPQINLISGNVNSNDKMETQNTHYLPKNTTFNSSEKQQQLFPSFSSIEIINKNNLILRKEFLLNHRSSLKNIINSSSKFQYINKKELNEDREDQKCSDETFFEEDSITLDKIDNHYNPDFYNSSYKFHFHISDKINQKETSNGINRNQIIQQNLEKNEINKNTKMLDVESESELKKMSNKGEINLLAQTEIKNNRNLFIQKNQIKPSEMIKHNKSLISDIENENLIENKLTIGMLNSLVEINKKQGKITKKHSSYQFSNLLTPEIKAKSNSKSDLIFHKTNQCYFIKENLAKNKNFFKKNIESNLKPANIKINPNNVHQNILKRSKSLKMNQSPKIHKQMNFLKKNDYIFAKQEKQCNYSSKSLLKKLNWQEKNNYSITQKRMTLVAKTFQKNFHENKIKENIENNSPKKEKLQVLKEIDDEIKIVKQIINMKKSPSTRYSKFIIKSK